MALLPSQSFVLPVLLFTSQNTYPAFITPIHMTGLPKSVSCLNAFRDVPQSVRSGMPQKLARHPPGSHRCFHTLMFSIRSLRVPGHVDSQTPETFT